MSRRRWFQDEAGRVHTPLEPVVLVATFALIPVLVIEADVESGGWLTVAYVANWVIWGLFAIELAAVLIVATRKKAALRAHWLDAAIVVLTIPLLGPVLSALRLARFLRFARFAVILARALQAQRRITSGDALKIASLVTVAVVWSLVPLNRFLRAGSSAPSGTASGGLLRRLRPWATATSIQRQRKAD
jgi:hypothetical protein